jgi:hypothetical protein
MARSSSSVETSAAGPRLPTLVLQQIGNYLGYAQRGPEGSLWPIPADFGVVASRQL